MQAKYFLLMSAVLISLTTSTASAYSRVTEPAYELILRPTSATLVPETFDYRFDATRNRSGCFYRDFLQKKWFPNTWTHSANITPADGGDYTIAFARNRTEQRCDARMGIYNYVSVVWTDPQDPAHTYRGVMQIDAGGTDSSASVRCFLSNPAEPWNSLECEQAVVSFARGPVTIVMNLDGLP